MSITEDFSNHYALIIGTGTDTQGNVVDKYKSTINDAKWFTRILVEVCSFPATNVTTLTAYDTTRDVIIAALDDIKKTIKSKKAKTSTVVLFFSGHCRNFGGTAYLMPYGCQENELATQAIDGDLLIERLNALFANKVLILLNTCYAGAVIPKFDDGSKAGTPLTQDQIDMLSMGRGVTVLSAAQASERAETAYRPKSSTERYSPFTIALGRTFAGVGKTNVVPIGLLYTSDLITECTLQVQKLTKGRQKPAFDYQGDNFLVGCFKRVSVGLFPLLGDEDEIAVDIEKEVEGQEEKNLAPPPGGTSPSTTYGGPVNAPRSVNGTVMIGGSGNFTYNYTEKN